MDVIKSAGSVLLDAANPISNISDNGIFGAPVPSAVKGTAESLADAVSGLAKSSLKFIQGDGVSFDWAESLVDAAWNWVPGGAAITRATDTAKTMMQGYGTAKNGNIKFYTEPTVGKALKAAAFGVNSLKDAEEYRMSGYKSIPENTVTKTSNIKAASPGMSWYQAYANKSDVNSNQQIEVTEKQRIKSLPDEEVEARLERLKPKIIEITELKKA